MSEIDNWYAGKNILVTGATGFIGKCLVVKLLKCPNIGNIYVMMRSTAKMNFDMRKSEYINNIAFQDVRDVAQRKLIIFHGHLNNEDLGISIGDRQQIIDNVNVIFHVAANVKFDDTLTSSYKQNVRGTKYLLDLATNIENLFPIGCMVEEKHYPSVHNVHEMDKIIMNMDENILNAFSHKLSDRFKNTYGYTKNLGESLVHTYKDKLCIGICRPSIVCAAVKEPLPSFTEGLHGPNGWSVATSTGILRTMICKVDSGINMIPVDSVVNAMIVLAYNQGYKNRNNDEILYFNVTRSRQHYLTWETMLDALKHLERAYPPNIGLFPPGGSATSSRLYHYVRMYLFQILPAVLVDAILIILRKPTLLVRAQRKISYMLTLLQVYMTTVFVFDTKICLERMNALNAIDRKIYYSNDDLINADLLVVLIIGCKVFVRKESLDDLPKAKKFRQRVNYGLQIIKMLILLFVFQYILNNYNFY